MPGTLKSLFFHARLFLGKTWGNTCKTPPGNSNFVASVPVSYTHLTLPTKLEV